MPFMISPNVLQPRPAANKEIDASALRAIAQAAVNVELFTIPLYMTTLYSLVGTHQITSTTNTFYKGRQWPGLAPTAAPKHPNEQAFNVIFSVFIEEMLHLQIASNVASAIGATPTFTSPMLQTANHGWICYGPDNTVIPHIVDLLDTSFDKVRVKLGPLDADQLALFLAIEEPEADARKAIEPDKLHKYFPAVPFKDWQVGSTEADLPMFGTIGWMYTCYWNYLNLTYDDGTTLIDYVFNPRSIQNDMFNVVQPPGHPMPEYPGFKPTLKNVELSAALPQIEAMLNAITDQGEGSTLPKDPPEQRLVVETIYRASKTGLEADYPGVTDTGQQAPSPDAAARADNDKPDHYDRFCELLASLDKIETWPQWFASGKSWTAEDLEAPDYDPTCNPHNLPTTTEVAAAINRMGCRDQPEDRAKNYKLLTQATIGALAGMTSVLDQYWSQSDASFPYPAMVGSGDRMGICWAVFGEVPDLSIGIGDPTPGKLQHSCQGLDFDGDGRNSCANVEIFHACKGSNNCAAQGGCGFVNSITGGGSCSSALRAGRGAAAAAASTDYSAPSDNKCATTGGCAVPISASQLLVLAGTMQLYDFGTDTPPEKIGTMQFEIGENVHDVAYRAYREVMKHRGKAVPETPPPNDDLRLVFIPST